MAEAATWTIRKMLEWCEGYLSRHHDEHPRRSAEWLVGRACGLERIELYLDLDRPLAPDELDILREDVRKRGQGMPLQYITGTAAFRYLEVKVAPGVLIPRPETEVLVSEALALLPAAPKPQDHYDEVLLKAMRSTEDEGVEPFAISVADGETAEHEDEAPCYLVADLCTGTGCIACSLASEHPQVKVVATDISPDAVALARENVRDCSVDDRVEVLTCDLGEGIDSQLKGCFDLVVSNPPYVPTGVLKSIPREVSDFEPALALDGGADGLDIFRRLAIWAFEALKPGGHLVCELHETCLDEASSIAKDAGYGLCRIVDDLAGRPRVIVAQKPDEWPVSN